MKEIELRHAIRSLAEGDGFEAPLYELYHENSKLFPYQVSYYQRLTYFNNSRIGFELVKRAAKSYACAHRIALPLDANHAAIPLTTAIESRRSIRKFGGKEMQLVELAKLLKYSNGVAEVTRDEPLTRRAIPSGGALYPTELYVLPLDIPALGPGAFHYEVSTHSLARFIDAPAEPMLARACYTEAALPTASVAFVISACFERQRIKYGERAYRFALLECGHLGQNLLLMGTAMGLGTLAVGGFLDDEINGYLRLNGHQEAAIYVILMGSMPRSDHLTGEGY